MDGAPVNVVWIREDDIRHGFYHTVTAERLEARLDKDSKVAHGIGVTGLVDMLAEWSRQHEMLGLPPH
jgi:CO/xanthine dehydrogenase Mo-binding subunit